MCQGGQSSNLGVWSKKTVSEISLLETEQLINIIVALGCLETILLAQN